MAEYNIGGGKKIKIPDNLDSETRLQLAEVVKDKYGIDINQIKDELKDSLIIDKILQEGDNFAYLKAKTPGPIQRIIGAEEDAWIMPPTSLSRENGFLMTIHGTPKGLKRIKDKLELV